MRWILRQRRRNEPIDSFLLSEDIRAARDFISHRSGNIRVMLFQEGRKFLCSSDGGRLPGCPIMEVPIWRCSVDSGRTKGLVAGLATGRSRVLKSQVGKILSPPSHRRVRFPPDFRASRKAFNLSSVRPGRFLSGDPRLPRQNSTVRGLLPSIVITVRAFKS